MCLKWNMLKESCEFPMSVRRRVILLTRIFHIDFVLADYQRECRLIFSLGP